MTSRQKFERWAKRQKLPIDTMQEMTRNGPKRFYAIHDTAIAWAAWTAAWRAKR